MNKLKKSFLLLASVVGMAMFAACSGEDGATGAKGEVGEAGIDGKNGKDGVGCTLSDTTSKSGLEGVVITCGEDVRVVWNGTDGKDGEDGADGKDGADGEDGEEGEKGKTGAKGDQGAKGEDGADGDDGKDGASCTVEPIKDGYKVVCGGDSVGVVLNGTNGTPGEKGDQGKDGEDGKDGTSCKLVNDTTVFTIDTYVKCGDEDSVRVASINTCAEYPEKSNGISMKEGIDYGCFKDERNGQSQIYRAVKIGTQTWMAENLNYEYNEGTAKSYCYNSSADSCAKYGRLYTWAAAMDSAAQFSDAGKDCGYGKTCSPSGTIRGVCPAGWHIPTKAELDTLLSNANYAALQATGYSSWTSATNESGFSGLPAGYRYDGDFYRLGSNAVWWSAAVSDSTYAGGLYLDGSSANVSNGYDGYKYGARSVRCLQD